MFGYDLHDPAWKTAGMVCNRNYCKRIYHQRIPSGSSRQRYCDRCKLLGKIQNGIPDVHADPSDLGGAFNMIAQVLIWVSLVLTIVSLIDYIAKNVQVLTQGGM